MFGCRPLYMNACALGKVDLPRSHYLCLRTHRREFVGSAAYNDLMSAMGLNSSNSADLTATDLKEEDNVGLFSSDTEELLKISNPETDHGFKNFFTAYGNSREIR